MANEVAVTASLSCTNGNFKLPTHGGAFNADQATIGGGVPGMLDLTTTEEDISLAELTAEGWVWMKNLEATGGDNIIWGVKSGGSYYEVGRLYPGEACVFRAGSSLTYYAHTATNTARLHMVVLDA